MTRWWSVRSWHFPNGSGCAMQAWATHPPPANVPFIPFPSLTRILQCNDSIYLETHYGAPLLMWHRLFFVIFFSLMSLLFRELFWCADFDYFSTILVSPISRLLSGLPRNKYLYAVICALSTARNYNFPGSFVENTLK